MNEMSKNSKEILAAIITVVIILIAVIFVAIFVIDTISWVMLKLAIVEAGLVFALHHVSMSMKEEE